VQTVSPAPTYSTVPLQLPFGCNSCAFDAVFYHWLYANLIEPFLRLDEKDREREREKIEIER